MGLWKGGGESAGGEGVVDAGDVLDLAGPAVFAFGALAEGEAVAGAEVGVGEVAEEAAGEAFNGADGDAEAGWAEEFAGDGAVVGDDGEAGGHVVEDFAVALGFGALGGDGDVEDAQHLRGVVVGDAAGEVHVAGEAGGSGGVAVGVLVGEAHDEEVGAGVVVQDELGGADEVVGSLVGGKQAQVADEQAVGRDAQAVAEIQEAIGVFGLAGTEAGEVDTVGDGDDAAGGQAGFGDEGVSGVLGTGENAVGQAVGQLFEPGEDVEQGVGGADELMVEHLARETALVVEHEPRAMHASEEPADEHAFVQVGVDDVHGPRGQAGEGGGEQGGVEHELAPVRADARAATVEPGGDADDGQAGRVVSAGIRYNGNVVAMLLEGAGFFENANVAAVVREEAGRRDFEDMTTHDARLPYTRNLRRSGPTEAKWILGVWRGWGNGGEPGAVLQAGRCPEACAVGTAQRREDSHAVSLRAEAVACNRGVGCAEDPSPISAEDGGICLSPWRGLRPASP